MAGNAQGQWEGNQVIGHYRLLWPFSGESGGPWQVYAARHVATGSPALLMRPKEGSVWAPQRNWQGRVSACAEPPYLVLDVDRLPDLHTLPALTSDLDDLTTMCEWIDYRKDAAEHLRSRPRKPRAQRGQEGARAVEVKDQRSRELASSDAPMSAATELGGGDTPARENQMAAAAVEHTTPTLAAVEQSSPRPVLISTLLAWRRHLATLAVASLAALVLVPSTLHEQRTAPQAGTGGTASAGIADAALTAPAMLPTGRIDTRGSLHALGREMPESPFKGQYRVDKDGKCQEAIEVPIKGGCWVQIVATPEACKKRGYEWKGKCYWPAMPSEREPSSTLPVRVPSAPAMHAQ